MSIDASIDTANLSVTGKILKRLMDGEALTSRQVMAEYGCSDSTMSVALSKFKASGVKVDRTGTVPNPNPSATDPNGTLIAYRLADDNDQALTEALFKTMRPERLSIRVARWFIAHPDHVYTIDSIAEAFPNEDRKVIGSSLAALYHDKVREEFAGHLNNGPTRSSYIWKSEGRPVKNQPTNGDGKLKRGELIGRVAAHCKANAGKNLRAETVAAELGLGQNPVRSAMTAMVSGPAKAEYRGMIRVEPGVYRWVGLKRGQGSNGNGKHSNGDGAVEHVPADVPASQQNAPRGPSQVASAMLGFDTHGAPALPPTGSLVRVIGQMLDEESGDVKLMVKNAFGTWVTDVHGVAMRDEVEMPEGGG